MNREHPAAARSRPALAGTEPRVAAARPEATVGPDGAPATAVDRLHHARAALQRVRDAATGAQAALLRRVEAAEADAVRLRGQLIRRATEIALLRDEIDRLHAETPGLPTRLALVSENRRQADQLLALRRALGSRTLRPARAEPRPRAAPGF